MRNYKPERGGEVDLVCRVRGRAELVFVEVKTRSSVAFGFPQEAVDGKRRRRLVQAAQEWLDELHEPGVVARFDVVEIFWQGGAFRLRHFPNAFLAAETRHPGSVPPTLGATRGDALPGHAHGDAGRFPRRRVRG